MLLASFNSRTAGVALGAVETIEAAAVAGFAAVDLLVRDLVRAGDDPAELRRRMDDLGLRGGAFPLPVDWKGDESTYRSGVADLPRLAAIAAALGLRRTGTWVLPELPDDGTADPYGATVRLHCDRLGKVADILGSAGIRLGLEVIGAESFRSGTRPRFLTRLGELRPTLGPLFERPNVGILLDSFHLHAADEPLDEALAGGIDSVVWVHVADLPRGASADRRRIVDSERGLPGDSGLVDNRGLLETIRRLGYDGPVTAEPLGRSGSLGGLTAGDLARTVVRSLRSVWPAEDGGERQETEKTDSTAFPFA